MATVPLRTGITKTSSTVRTAGPGLLYCRRTSYPAYPETEELLLGKSQQLQTALLQGFGKQVDLLSYGSGLHLHIALHLPGTAEELARKALMGG